MTSTLAPYNWLRKIPADLKKLDEVPLFGISPSFNLHTFEKKLSELLLLPDLKATFHPIELKDKEHIKEGFKQSRLFSFQVAPLAGLVTLLVPRNSFDHLIKTLSLQEAETETHLYLSNPDVRDAFIYYVLLEGLHSFQTGIQDKSLSPQLTTEPVLEETLSEEAAWTMDGDLNWTGGSLTFRLVIPQNFRQSWKTHYAKTSLTSSPALMNVVSMDVHIQAGRVELTQNEWQSVKPGDFVVLDSCHLIAGEDKGRVLLTVKGTPFFRAKIKDGNLKILEYPLFYDVGSPIDKLTGNKLTPKIDETMIDDEFEDDHFDEDEFAEDETDLDFEDKEHATEELNIESEALVKKDQVNEKANSKESQAPLKADEIPLDIIIEVGRFQMNIQKLSELQPGNLIPLDIHPDQGVDLVINGFCVAKGELLKLGDNLGVRILDIAK